MPDTSPPTRTSARIATRPEPDSDGFGQLIARRRRELGLTQRERAERLCAESGRPTFTRHEVSRYERGLRLPAAALLTLMATALDLPPSRLRAAAAQQRDHRATDRSGEQR